MAAVGDVNVSLGVHRGICHGMKIVGNLHAQVKREGLARGARCLHAHDASGRAFRHARDQIVLRGDQHTRFGFPETHVRPRVRPGNEARAVNRDVAAGNACGRLDAVNARYAVGFQIHSQRKLFHQKPNSSGKYAVAVARLFRGEGLDVTAIKTPPLKRRATAGGTASSMVDA